MEEDIALHVRLLYPIFSRVNRIFATTWSRSFGGCDDVVFSGKDGMFLNITPLQIDGLPFP